MNKLFQELRLDEGTPTSAHCYNLFAAEPLSGNPHKLIV